ncbi:hypothetical protein [Chromobacterium rhizoryzae]|uniref:hypothetical protein n=1 Tax=Chromobacterium rhizoryzae TaxID=1778675 RepID=UPI001D07E8A7|nr:hypothetical protein [Chromobacterium rhizoryzae]
MERDFRYIRELLAEFFNGKQVQNGLKLIKANEIAGWEIWLQIEFARFLSTHNSEPEWWREVPLGYDLRREKERSFLKPDFLIRKKGWKIGSYAVLEIKQHPDVGNCMSNMMRDMVKVSKMRQSALEMRTYWALGIFEVEEPEVIREILFNKADEYNVPVSTAYHLIEKIPKTPYCYLLF